MGGRGAEQPSLVVRKRIIPVHEAIIRICDSSRRDEYST